MTALHEHLVAQINQLLQTLSNLHVPSEQVKETQNWNPGTNSQGLRAYPGGVLLHLTWKRTVALPPVEEINKYMFWLTDPYK